MTWLPLPPGPPPPPSRPSWIRRFGAIVAVAAAVTLVAAVVALASIRPVARIEGSAMAPLLQDGDRTLFFPVSGPLERGAVVKFRYPGQIQRRVVPPQLKRAPRPKPRRPCVGRENPVRA